MKCSPFSAGRSISVGNGLSLNYETQGSGDEAALFVHGFGASLRNWDDVRPHLSTRYASFFVDLKGCGFSSKPEDGRYSVVEHALIVRRFINALGLTSVTLVGHSYGGAVALLTYQCLVDSGESDKVVKLILLDSAGFAMGGTYPLCHLRIPGWGWFLVNALPPRIQAYTTLRLAFSRPSRITPRILCRYTYWYADSLWRRALLCAAKEAVPQAPAGFQKRFHEIQQKCLLIWGKDDRIIPLSHLDSFRRVIPHTSELIIEDCGHMPHEEQPRLTAEAIDGFLVSS